MSWLRWLQLAALAVLWGIPYLFIEVALAELTPAAVALGRVAFATAVVVPVAWLRGRLGSLRSDAPRLALVAALDIVAPFVLVAVAQRTITSGLAAILVATVPLFVMLFARWLDPGEPIGGTRSAGFLAGFAGVAVLFGVDLDGGSGGALGGALVLAASACYAAAALLVRRWFTGTDSITLTAGVLALATVMLLPAMAIAPPDPPSPHTIAAVAALGTASTAAAFLLFYNLVQLAGAGSAAMVTYLAPAVAVIAGVLLLDEPAGVGTFLGLTLILAGSAVAARQRRRRRPILSPPEDGPPQSRPLV